MTTFRKILIRIRKYYREKKPQLFAYSTLGVIVFGALSIALDAIIPWENWGMFLRTLALVPLSLSLSVLGYALALAYCDAKLSENLEWQSWRERLSPTWRRRASMIVGSVLVVLAIASSNKQVGYTLITAVILSVAVGLIIFMRATADEVKRARFGIPDARDVVLNHHLANYNHAEARAKKKLEASEAKIQEKVARAKAKLAAAEEAAVKATKKQT